MTTVELYDLTVPVYIRQLKNLAGVLKKSQQWCADNGKPDSYLLEGRLAPDMKELPFQIAVVNNQVRSGLPGPAFKFHPSSQDPIAERDFASMQARIQATVDFLETIKPEDLIGGATAPITIWPSGTQGVGPEFNFSTGINYLTQFAWPNMFFHLSTAYGICRNKGVPLGKADYIAGCGAGFS